MPHVLPLLNERLQSPQVSAHFAVLSVVNSPVFLKYSLRGACTVSGHCAAFRQSKKTVVVGSCFSLNATPHACCVCVCCLALHVCRELSWLKEAKLGIVNAAAISMGMYLYCIVELTLTAGIQGEAFLLSLERCYSTA